MKPCQAMIAPVSIAAALALSGCDTIGQSVLLHALEDAKAGDLQAFQSHFDGEALAELGTPAGMARVQSLSNRWENLTADETLVNEYLKDGRHNRIYREDIYGQNGNSQPIQIGIAIIHCSNIRIWNCAISNIKYSLLVH